MTPSSGLLNAHLFILHAIVCTHGHTCTHACPFVVTHSPENSQERCTRTAFPGLSSSLWQPSHKTIKKYGEGRGGVRRWEKEASEFDLPTCGEKYTHCAMPEIKKQRTPETAVRFSSARTVRWFSRTDHLNVTPRLTSTLLSTASNAHWQQCTISSRHKRLWKLLA